MNIYLFVLNARQPSSVCVVSPIEKKQSIFGLLWKINYEDNPQKLFVLARIFVGFNRLIIFPICLMVFVCLLIKRRSKLAQPPVFEQGSFGELARYIIDVLKDMFEISDVFINLTLYGGGALVSLYGIAYFALLAKEDTEMQQQELIFSTLLKTPLTVFVQHGESAFLEQATIFRKNFDIATTFMFDVLPSLFGVLVFLFLGGIFFWQISLAIFVMILVLGGISFFGQSQQLAFEKTTELRLMIFDLFHGMLSNFRNTFFTNMGPSLSKDLKSLHEQLQQKLSFVNKKKQLFLVINIIILTLTFVWTSFILRQKTRDIQANVIKLATPIATCYNMTNCTYPMFTKDFLKLSPLQQENWDKHWNIINFGGFGVLPMAPPTKKSVLEFFQFKNNIYRGAIGLVFGISGFLNLRSYSRFLQSFISAQTAWQNCRRTSGVIRQPQTQAPTQSLGKNFSGEITIKNLSCESSLFNSIEQNRQDKVRQQRKIFSNINLRIPEGAILLIMGPSGGGKTTFLNIVAGGLPYMGGIFVGDMELSDIPTDELRKHILFFSNGGLFSGKSVADNIFLSCTRNLGMLQKILRKLNLEHLNPDAIIPSATAPWLSNGERQRIGLAAIIYALMQDKAKNIRFICLDEVCAGLDRRNAINALSFIIELAKERNITVLIIEHVNLINALKFTGIAFIYNGGLVYGGVDEMLKNREFKQFLEAEI